MQNKGFIQFLVIVLAFASLYQLSFTFVARSVEKKAETYADGDINLERAFLDSIANEVVFNLLVTKFTYREVKQREINLGLDLKGGMNVTLEVSLADLLKAMANNTDDETFNKAITNAVEVKRKSSEDFITIFFKEFRKLDPNASLASPRIFGHQEQDMVNYKMTNEEVVAVLRKEADQAVERTFQVLNARIDKFGVTQPNIQKIENTGRIVVELPGVKDPARVRQLLQGTAKLEFWETFDFQEIYPSFEKINEYLAKLEGSGRKTDESLVDENDLEIKDDSLATEDNLISNVEDAEVSEFGEGFSEEDTKAFEDFKKENPFFAVLEPAFAQDPETGRRFPSSGPVMGYSLTKDTAKVNRYLAMPGVRSLLPKNLKLLWSNKPMKGTNVMVLYGMKVSRRDGRALLEGDVITAADFRKNEQGSGFMVEMKMNAEGADKWAKITEANKGKSIAIVLDDLVYSAPTVQDKISGGISSITGDFSFDEAKALSSILKAGKLPAPARIVEEAIVGPSLGQESIRKGVTSFIIAFALVLIYILFYYNMAGFASVVALLANVFFIIGGLASLGTTLTLPGIAGLVLTIGMSVDANVIIFERIKEELADGKGVRLAISDGFSRSLSAILDANVTTMLTAIILMVFGEGPVKGFAVVLFVGIIFSFFTAIFITRLIFEARLNAKKEIKFSIPLTEKAFKNTNIQFIKNRKIYYIVSGIIIAMGIVSFATKSFNLGVDLKGGRSYTVSFDNTNISTTDIANALATPLESAPTVKFFGGSDKIRIITKYKFDDASEEVDIEVKKILFDKLKSNYVSEITFEQFIDKDFELGISESYIVGPTIAKDIKTKSIYAIIFSLIVMFLYIMIRFKGWQYATGAIAALVHDVIVVLAMFSIFDGILPFSLEIDQAIIAAVLTVIGYSINDTVVVFDRIREFLSETKRKDPLVVMNNALNSTLSRTMNTSATTLFVLFVIFLFGGPAIKGMAFALLIGILVGTYSSLCIASSVVADFTKKKEIEK